MTKEWLDDRVRNFDFGDTHRPRWEVLGRSGGIPFPEIIWNWELRKCVFQRLLFTFWTFNSAHFGNKKISSRWWKQHFLIYSTIIRDTYLVLYSKEDFKSPSSTRFQSFFCASRSSTKEPDYTDYLVIQNGDKYVRGEGGGSQPPTPTSAVPVTGFLRFSHLFVAPLRDLIFTVQHKVDIKLK